jgi:hypothetical protein
MHAHTAAYVGKYDVAVIQLHAEHSVRKRFHDGSFYLYCALFRQCIRFTALGELFPALRQNFRFVVGYYHRMFEVHR